MDCQFTEKISLLLDDELSPEETKQTRAHIEVCQNCRDLHTDFLFFRQQIKGLVTQQPTTIKNDAPQIVRQKIPLWQKEISFPIPVFALILIAFVGLAAWFLTSHFNQTTKLPTAENSDARTMTEALPDKQNEFSLARFDKGGRAEIYTTRRQLSVNNEKSGETKK